LWSSKTVSEEVPVEEADTTEAKKADPADEATIEDEASSEEEAKPKTKNVSKTVWDWELMNMAKPIWQRKTTDVTEEEYQEFYKTFTKDSAGYLAYNHFSAEGEVSFKSILFVPKTAPSDIFQNYNKAVDTIKMYVRRVFISESVDELIPKYLSFIRGIVDSDDLPLNVSRETLQQSKLLKIIKKKVVRKILDMIKKLSEEEFMKFWREYGTNIKLGVIEDAQNKNRLANLLRFESSNSSEERKMTSLEDYVKRMKPGQEFIYFIAGTGHVELAQSPFVEKLLKKVKIYIFFFYLKITFKSEKNKLISNLLKLIYKMISNLLKLISNLLKLISNLLKLIYKLISNLLKLIYKLISNLLKLIYKLISNLLKLIYKLISNLLKLIYKLISNLLKLIYKFISNLEILKLKLTTTTTIKIYLILGL